MGSRRNSLNALACNNANCVHQDASNLQRASVDYDLREIYIASVKDTDGMLFT